MREWFDSRADDAPRSLPPEKERKVREIKAALEESDGFLRAQFVSLASFERYAMKHVVRRLDYLGSAINTLAKIHAELLRARDRLERLHTGLRAESLLRSALTETAAAVDAWRRGLDSTEIREVDASIVVMQRHFKKAGVLGRAGARDLRQGR